MMKLKTFLLHTEAVSQIDLLSDEEAGQLIKALFHYAAEGAEPVSPNRVLTMTFAVLKAQIDRETERYNGICQKRKEAINKRWEQYKSVQENTNSSPTPQRAKEKVDIVAITARLNKKKEDFYNSLVPFVTLYGKDMVREFFDYWTEPNKSGTKMRFELEKTWSTNRRLNTWASKMPVINKVNDERDRRQQDAARIMERIAAENGRKLDTGGGSF